MTRSIIPKRTRFFLAVEGPGEQSFAKWLHTEILVSQKLHIHLDYEPLGGGGYSAMLKTAILYRERGIRRGGKYKDSFLLLDADRAEQHGEWSIDYLRAEAKKARFEVCIQHPNQEGVLLRMIQGNENLILNSKIEIMRKLKKYWPDYEKPISTHTLKQRFTITDLLRLAQIDADLKNLLTKIGLI